MMNQKPVSNRERRRNNAVRAARREAHFTKASRRTDAVPVYQEFYDETGNVVKRVYVGHQLVRVKKQAWQTWKEDK